MGILDDFNTVRNTRQNLFYLTMLTSIVGAVALSNSVAKQDIPQLFDNTIQELPFCGDRHDRTIARRLVYISTLDGRLSALDITKEGKRRWSIPTGPGPLLSSSIHKLELTNNGEFVRMIPSLNGGIYKFDGESIDPIPVNADTLLSSSAKFSDDMVISGGKETRTYGVSARTGQILYECSMHGCSNATDAGNTNSANNAEDVDGDTLIQHDPLVDDVIVVRRQTQTVRAVDSRTGDERWNFSVGQHYLDLMKPADCHESDFSDLDMAVLDLQIKVMVPDGIICAFSKSQPKVMLWKYKFDHPIVSVWKIGANDELESIDMFGSAVWKTEYTKYGPLNPTIAPSIYLGMYEKQLYIQESINLQKEIIQQSNINYQLTNNGNNKMPHIPWRPIAASGNALILVEDDKIIGESTAWGSTEPTNIMGNELVPYNEENSALSAQSVLNASENMNGNGFYFYTSNDVNTKLKAICNSDDSTQNATVLPKIEATVSNVQNNTDMNDLGFSLDDIDAPVKVVILSLWFWWKEIVVIAFTSAILLNLFLGQRQRPEREIVVIERHIPVPTAMEATEYSTAALLGPVTNSLSKSTTNTLTNGQRTLSESTTNSGEHFSSRFQGDFELMRCLGHGGFGVVFEAKNKLDDCKYAVKRITLPNKKDSRDRVMREVKTLANCEHQNIVRYFQAWVETPPVGWQEEEDGKWLAHEMSISIQIENSNRSLSSSNLTESNRQTQVANKKQLMSWVSSVTSTACSNDPECSDDDSCVVFRTESQSMAHNDESQIRSSGNKTNENKRIMNTVTDAVSIDIHSNVFDKCLNNGTNLDYSQLSDSFQIEFIRSTNGFKDEVDTDVSVFSEIPQNDPKFRSIPENNYYNKSLLATTSKPIAQRSSQNKVYLYIQMQLCRKESLRDWLRENCTKSRTTHVDSIFHQIVDAVDYVHFKGLIHRDLKPSNIFFSQDGQIKIGDFGLVTDMSDIPNIVTKCGDNSGLPSCARHTQQVGTHLYMSPEQLRGQHYDYKVDIYSLGLIYFELLVYFSTEMERIVTLRNLREGRYPDEFATMHPAEFELLKLMLSAHPHERPSTLELKKQLLGILKLTDWVGKDGETSSSKSKIARTLSHSSTFGSSE